MDNIISAVASGAQGAQPVDVAAHAAGDAGTMAALEHDEHDPSDDSYMNVHVDHGLADVLGRNTVCDTTGIDVTSTDESRATVSGVDASVDASDADTSSAVHTSISHKDTPPSDWEQQRQALIDLCDASAAQNRVLIGT